MTIQKTASVVPLYTDSKPAPTTTNEVPTASPLTEQLVNRRLQKEFHKFVADVMSEESTAENAIYQSVMSTVYTLIEDQRLVNLHTVLKMAFPAYYHQEAE